MKYHAIFFRIGSYGMIVTSIFHMVGHVAGFPPPANATEATLIDLMGSYQFTITGLNRSMMDFLNGYSFTFAVLILFAGVFNLVIMRFHADSGRFMRAITLLNILMLGILLVIAGIHFIYPPIVAFAFCLIAFSLSLFVRRGKNMPT